MILIKTKNAVAASDVATRTDLIKSKKIKVKKIFMSISVTADDEINQINLKENKKINDI